MNGKLTFAAIPAFLILAGCQTDGPLRYEGVTSGAGNAIAANTVMQMVDPWPAGVENTDLVTPADHDQYRRQAASEASDASESGTTTN